MKLTKHNSTTVYFILLAIITFSCSALKTKESDFIKTQVYKSKEGYTYLTMNSYSSESPNQKFPGIYNVNGIVFTSVNTQSVTLSATPGKYLIQARLIGQISIKNSIKTQKGDSTVINFYLTPQKVVLD